MSIKVSIFAQDNSEGNDEYTDYKEIIPKLPIIRWTPNTSGSSSKMFQGVAEVANVQFFAEVLRKTGTSAIMTLTDDGIALILANDPGDDDV